MNRKQFAQIYRDAAKRVEKYRDSCSCSAVWSMLKDVEEDKDQFELDSTRDYAELFAPTPESACRMFWLSDTGMSEYECRNWRVLALGFAAAMIETGDLKVPVR